MLTLVTMRRTRVAQIPTRTPISKLSQHRTRVNICSQNLNYSFKYVGHSFPNNQIKSSVKFLALEQLTKKWNTSMDLKTCQQCLRPSQWHTSWPCSLFKCQHYPTAMTMIKIASTWSCRLLQVNARMIIRSRFSDWEDFDTTVNDVPQNSINFRLIRKYLQTQDICVRVIAIRLCLDLTNLLFDKNCKTHSLTSWHFCSINFV